MKWLFLVTLSYCLVVGIAREVHGETGNLEVAEWCTTCRCYNQLVDCQNAGISSIPTINDSTITTLYLSNNRISSIEEEAFAELHNLTTLYFENNAVETIENGSFAQLKFLNSLFLSSNSIAEIETGSFDGLESLEYLILDDNNLTSINQSTFLGLPNIMYLSLENNRINYIADSAFQHLKTLKFLNLANNDITAIGSRSFSGLESLEWLELPNNAIKFIAADSFYGLQSLTTLDLKNNNLEFITKGLFDRVGSLQQLYLGCNRIQSIEDHSLDGLKCLRELDLRRNFIEVIKPTAFPSGSRNLTLFSDDWKVCCTARLSNISCTDTIYNPADPFSSCEDLLHQTVLRHSIWILGIFATSLNVVVILCRIPRSFRSKSGTPFLDASSCLRDTSSRINNLLTTSLAFGDLFMGIFLLIIASVDISYRGYYVLQDDKWRRSWLCHTAGFLCAFSSEFSVFILTVMTLDRYVIISSRGKRLLDLKHIRILVGFSALVALLLSAIPLILNVEYFENFYGRSGVCLALPFRIASGNPVSSGSNPENGWEYSFSVFVVLNFISVLVLIACYVRIVLIMRKSAEETNKQSSKKDSILIQRVLMIVGTDIACWLPIIALCFVNRLGLNLPNTVYAWIAVFVLPINSALNPMIYTFYTPVFRERLQEKWEKLKKSGYILVNYTSGDSNIFIQKN